VPSATKSLEIKPSLSKTSAAVAVNNLKPGEKIKVTIIEGKPINSPAKTTPTPTNPKGVQIAPKTTGSRADVGISNLKTGQQIKVTIKDGAKK
jgi:hypothetical protein